MTHGERKSLRRARKFLVRELSELRGEEASPWSRAINVHFLRSMQRWIGLERGKSQIGFRPHRTIELDDAYDRAFERCQSGIEDVLGAIVRTADKKAGAIEAGFGTVNQERIVCSLEAAGPQRTRVRIEARFPANVAAPARSVAVETLADYLES